MTIQATYGHTNIAARDWKRLAQFYIDVFGCELVPPERDLTGDPIEKGTAVKGMHLRGAHIRLPGYGDSGPTLEIFQYDPMIEAEMKAVNRCGWGHIAFMVADVDAGVKEVLEHGGAMVGEVVTTPIGNTGHFYHWCYMTDPEGNVIELQVKD